MVSRICQLILVWTNKKRRLLYSPYLFMLLALLHIPLHIYPS